MNETKPTMTGYSMEGYVTVPERIALFYKRHPEGSLQMDPPSLSRSRANAG
jgi:hypothetical protein